MVDAAQAARRGRDDRRTGSSRYGAERVKGDRREGIRRQGRLRRPKRQDDGLRRSGVRALRGHARSQRHAGRDHRTGVPVHADRESALLRPRLDLRHPGDEPAEDDRRGARQGRPVVVLLSHNGMDVDLKLAGRVRGLDAILGGHTHDGVPQPIRSSAIAAARRSSPMPAPTASSSACSTSTCKGGKVADYRYRLLPVFSNLLPADRDMAALIDKVRAPLRGEARGEARRDRGTAVPPRQLQRHLRPADPRCADGGEERRDRVLAGIPLGHLRCCPARRSRMEHVWTRRRSPIPTRPSAR